MSNQATVSFAGYSFPEHKACRACNHVMDGAPVLYFLHESDGGLQFLCGADGHSDDDAMRVCVQHVVDKNSDLKQMPVVDFGFEAERSSKANPWIVQRCPEGY